MLFIVGGKTCHIAALMHNSGVLIALDKAKKKIDIINKNLDQAGCTIAQVYGFDSTKAVLDSATENVTG